MITILFTCASVLTLLVACFLFMIGIFMIRRDLQFGKRACSARAVIIDLKEGVHVTHRRGGGTISSPIYYPIVEFQRGDGLLAGQQVTCELRAGSYAAHYSIGREIPVLYDTSNPQLVQINTFRWRWLGMFLLFLMSFLALLIGVGVLLSIRGL